MWRGKATKGKRFKGLVQTRLQALENTHNTNNHWALGCQYRKIFGLNDIITNFISKNHCLVREVSSWDILRKN